jgi:Zn finger protein HypA/HybF involved in hydrogenase expression
MATELVLECPSCESDQAFYLTASTELHLGEKTKWVCPECEFRIVRIDGDIDSSVSSA